jgi:hypothetical protein
MMHQQYSHLIQGDGDDNFPDLSYSHHNLLNSIDTRGYIDMSNNNHNNLMHLSSLHHRIHGGDLNTFHHQDTTLNDLQQILPIIVSEQPSDMMVHPPVSMYSQAMHFQDMHNLALHSNSLALIQQQHLQSMSQGYSMLSTMPQQMHHYKVSSQTQSDMVAQQASSSSGLEAYQSYQMHSQNPNQQKLVRKKGKKEITPAVKQVILEKNREAQRRYRQSLSEEKRLATLEKNRQAHKRYRENLSSEAQALCREKNRIAQRRRRQMQTVETKMLAQEKNRQAQRRRRDQNKSVSSKDSSDDGKDNESQSQQGDTSYSGGPTFIPSMEMNPMSTHSQLDPFNLGHVNIMNGMQINSTSIPGNIHLEADDMKKFMGSGISIAGTGGTHPYNYNFKL